jgi:hypothetical protein
VVIRKQFRWNEGCGKVGECTSYMNLTMNRLVRQGYEFTGMTDDIVIMKRPVAR